MWRWFLQPQQGKLSTAMHFSKRRRKKIRYLIFFNPFAGRRSIETDIPYILSEIQSSGSKAEVYRMYSCANDALCIKRRMLEVQTYDSIIIAGGDGTISYIMGIMLELGVHVPIGLLPCGTCNDFSNVLSLGRTRKEQLQTILQGHSTPIDMATYVANGQRKYLICDYEFGGLSAVSYATSPRAKKFFGKLAYYFMLIKNIWSVRAFPVRISADGRTIDGDAFAVLILNGPRFAGVAKLLPNADISDGFMDLAILYKCKLCHVPKMIWRIVTGRIGDEPFAEVLQCKSAELSSAKKIDSTVDGEKGDSLPLKIEMLKGCMHIFTPSGNEGMVI